MSLLTLNWWASILFNSSCLSVLTQSLSHSRTLICNYLFLKSFPQSINLYETIRWFLIHPLLLSTKDSKSALHKTSHPPISLIRFSHLHFLVFYFVYSSFEIRFCCLFTLITHIIVMRVSVEKIMIFIFFKPSKIEKNNDNKTVMWHDCESIIICHHQSP